MIDHVLAVPEILQSRLFGGVVLPLAYRLGLMRFAEDAYAATGIFVLGALQVAGLWMVLRPLEAWRPVERWTDRRAVRVDVLYTLLERLGMLPLAFFFMLRPVVDGVDGGLRKLGWIPPNFEDVIPGLMASPLPANAQYFLTVDELLARGSEFVDEDVRVSGAVIGDSIQYHPDGLTLSFNRCPRPRGKQRDRSPGRPGCCSPCRSC